MSPFGPEVDMRVATKFEAK